MTRRRFMGFVLEKGGCASGPVNRKLSGLGWRASMLRRAYPHPYRVMAQS
jgi:hypothetical protein